MTTRTGDFDVEYQVFSPIPTAPAACGWSAELMHPGSDAEHHFGIGFMGFNKQSSAVDWHQVRYQYTAANDIAGGVIVAHGTRASGITGETTSGVVCLASFTDTWLTELLFAAIPLPETSQPHQLQTPTAPSTGSWPHLWDLQGTESFKVSWLFLPVPARTELFFAVARKGHGQDAEAILYWIFKEKSQKKKRRKKERDFRLSQFLLL